MINYSKQIMELAFRKLAEPSGTIILCSSGVDSIAASYYYNQHHQVNNPDSVHFAMLNHFNHGQRPQNDLMEEGFLKFAKDPRLKIPSYKVDNLKDRVKEKTEDGLRKARIEYIEQYHENTIFITAHHLDDAVESYLLNVLRGKEGYLPIPFITELKDNNLLVHPFLFTKKADFIQYADRNDLMKYVVEDETNKITKGSRRNFIRNDICPLLQREMIGLDTIVKKKMKERLLLELIKN